MANSRTESILQAMVAALSDSSGPAGLTVNRSRRQSVEPGELPMISVYPLEEAVQRSTENRRAAVTDRTLSVRIRCRAAGLDADLDPLRQWVVAQLGLATLSGLVLEVLETDCSWDAADASDDDYSVAEMQFKVRYVTARNDLTAAP